MEEDLKYHSEKYGLTMNIKKTKFMSNREGINENRLNGAKLSRVSEYRYLVQTSKFNNNMDGVIGERISNAWKSFWKNKIFLKSKMKTKLKLKILESCVLSVPTYRAQTWSLTNRQLQYLTTTQNSMIRSILGIRSKDKILVNNIWKQAGAKINGYKIK